MKKDIHPDYHEIKIVMTDGSERSVRSTWGSKGEVMKLSVDPLNHPAGTVQQRALGRDGMVARLYIRFSGLGVKN